jgi:hypothetical protein
MVQRPGGLAFGSSNGDTIHRAGLSINNKMLPEADTLLFLPPNIAV